MYYVTFCIHSLMGGGGSGTCAASRASSCSHQWAVSCSCSLCVTSSARAISCVSSCATWAWRHAISTELTATLAWLSSALVTTPCLRFWSIAHRHNSSKHTRLSAPTSRCSTSPAHPEITDKANDRNNCSVTTVFNNIEDLYGSLAWTQQTMCKCTLSKAKTKKLD